MITLNSRVGLHGLGDLGTVVPVGPISRAPEDSLLLGIGRRLQRDSVLLGAVASRAPAMGPQSRVIAPRTTQTFAPRVQSPVKTYTTPQYPTMPTRISPITQVTTPSPTGVRTPLIPPGGGSDAWPITPASPMPPMPPVAPPNTPAPPYVRDNNYWLTPGDPGTTYPSGAAYDPYAPPATSQPAGAQTALVTNSQTGETAMLNQDGTMTTADGTTVDAQGNIVSQSSAAWTWAKEHKVGIGIGLAAVIGAVVIAKVVL